MHSPNTASSSHPSASLKPFTNLSRPLHAYSHFHYSHLHCDKTRAYYLEQGHTSGTGVWEGDGEETSVPDAFTVNGSMGLVGVEVGAFVLSELVSVFSHHPVLSFRIHSVLFVSYPLPITIATALPVPWPRPGSKPVSVRFILNADRRLFVSIHSQPPLRRARCSPFPLTRTRSLTSPPEPFNQ